MKRLALALAAASALGLSAPAYAAGTSGQGTTVQTTVKAKPKMHRHAKKVIVRKKVVVTRHDRGLHRGFTHSRHLGYAKAHKPIKAKVKVKTQSSSY